MFEVINIQAIQVTNTTELTLNQYDFLRVAIFKMLKIHKKNMTCLSSSPLRMNALLQNWPVLLDSLQMRSVLKTQAAAKEKTCWP